MELRTATCDQTDVAEVGFVGRTLLNAFNALEYGEQQRRTDLVTNAYKILILICRMDFRKRVSLMK